MKREQEDLRRASQIYKFDLMTNMVGEFPELQGIMGEKYALIQGESPLLRRPFVNIIFLLLAMVTYHKQILVRF